MWWKVIVDVFIVIAILTIGGSFWACVKSRRHLKIGDIPASAKNNNATHVHTLVSNIYRWNQADSATCRDYCTREKSSLAHVYSLLSRVPISKA